MFKKLSIVAAMVIGLGSPAVAQTVNTAPVITYDGNVKVQFTSLDFTFVKDGEKINAGVEREACYGNYVNKYTRYASASRFNKVVLATPAELPLLREVCKKNPPANNDIGGFFNTRNRLWAN